MTTVQSCVEWRVHWSFRCDCKTSLSSYVRTREWKPSSESWATSLRKTWIASVVPVVFSFTLKPRPTYVAWVCNYIAYVCVDSAPLSVSHVPTFSPFCPIRTQPLFIHRLPPPPPSITSHLRYARKHFSSSGNEHLLKEIQTAMGLLAFSPTTKCKRYQVRWHSISLVNPV